MSFSSLGKPWYGDARGSKPWPNLTGICSTASSAGAVLLVSYIVLCVVWGYHLNRPPLMLPPFRTSFGRKHGQNTTQSQPKSMKECTENTRVCLPWDFSSHAIDGCCSDTRANNLCLDHCIEMLRINLMCTADVTPITAVIPTWKNSPTPDFSTVHTCRNFNKIL